jgi:hypothetical protein
MPLVAGADTSGDLMFVSLFVGSLEDVERIHSRFGVQEIHVSKRASRSEKEALVHSLKIEGRILSACIRVDRLGVVRRIENIKGMNPIKKQKLENRFNYALKKKLNDILGESLTENGSSLDSIDFQVDSDLSKTLKSVGLRCCNRGKAHELADIVAWANNGRMVIARVREFDFVEELYRLTLRGA